MNENVMACIMAYYPGSEFENVCSIIAQQVKLLLIIDNSIEGNLEMQGIKFAGNTIIICNYNKYAISGALNIGLSYAKDNGFDYLHIFDQDTVPPVDITSLLLSSFKNSGDVALIAPRFINSSTNFPGRVLVEKGKWRVKNFWPKTDVGAIEALFTISSASLINIKKLPREAFYDTRLIIDGCDIDFCLNLQQAGLKIIVDTAVCVYHGIGERKKGGGRWSATNYSPLRKQLSAKNRMIIWRRYKGDFPGYILNDTFVFLLDSARSVVLEKDRFKKLMALATGLWQGVKEKNIKKRVNSLQ